MNTNANIAEPEVKAPQAQTKRRLRDNPEFISLYTNIVAALHSRISFKTARANFVEYEDFARELAQAAYVAAQQAFAVLNESEPDAETQTQVEQFNAKL